MPSKQSENHTPTTCLPRLCRALAVLTVPALLAAGCGGSSSNGGESASQSSDVQALKWVQCMHQHGAPASESNNGHTISSTVHVGDANAPSQQQLQAARQACRQYLPNGGQSIGQPSAQQMDQLAKYVQCLNQHGVPAKVQGSSIESQPGPSGPEQQQQAEQACRQYAPAGS